MSVSTATQNLRIVYTQIFNHDFAMTTWTMHRFNFANIVPTELWKIDDECGVSTTRPFGNIHLGSGDQDREFGAISP